MSPRIQIKEEKKLEIVDVQIMIGLRYDKGVSADFNNK